MKFGKLERKEVPEVPIKALREALVNSLCHRDYKVPKGNEVAIFKDRIEIYNPGRFPEGLSPEDYIEGEERSVLRNPLIANMLYLSKDIEKWGSGLKRMHKECTTNDVRVEFRTLKTGFVVVFERKEELAKRWSERLVDGLADGLAENQKRILDLIESNPYISKKEMAKTIGISTTAIDKNIATLKKKGLLRRVGPAKGGHWEIIK